MNLDGPRLRRCVVLLSTDETQNLALMSYRRARYSELYSSSSPPNIESSISGSMMLSINARLFTKLFNEREEPKICSLILLFTNSVEPESKTSLFNIWLNELCSGDISSSFSSLES